MARCTVEEIKEIFSTTLEDDSITAFITSAHLFVNNTVAAADSPPDTATLKEIERWVAAHFCCLRDPIALRMVQGDSEQWSFPASVTTAWSRGLGLTVYGQQAILMDTTNTLSDITTQRRQATYRAAPRENSINFTRGLT